MAKAQPAILDTGSRPSVNITARIGVMELYEIECYPVHSAATSYTITIRVWARSLSMACVTAREYGYNPVRRLWH